LSEFSIVSKYDEINCDIIFGVFLTCILKCRLWLYGITMNLMF